MATCASRSRAGRRYRGSRSLSKYDLSQDERPMLTESVQCTTGKASLQSSGSSSIFCCRRPTTRVTNKVVWNHATALQCPHSACTILSRRERLSQRRNGNELEKRGHCFPHVRLDGGQDRLPSPCSGHPFCVVAPCEEAPYSLAYESSCSHSPALMYNVLYMLTGARTLESRLPSSLSMKIEK